MDGLSGINTNQSLFTEQQGDGLEQPDIALSSSETSKLAQGSALQKKSAIANRDVLPVPPVLGVFSAESSKPAQITVNDQQFFDECQALLRRSVLKPLPREGVRHIHGAINSSRVAMWIPVLISIRRSLGDQEAEAFPAEMLPWVMKAALLHCSGRQYDAFHDTEEEETMSGEICENHLLSIGCPASLAHELNIALRNMSGRICAAKTFIEKLLHDATCLEIMRVPEGALFDMTMMEIFQTYTSLKLFL